MTESKSEYLQYTDGLEYIPVVDKIMEREEAALIHPDVTVGGFGIVGSDGKVMSMFWKVSGIRTDKRHGYTGKAGYYDRNTKALLESMFKGW